ncbi:MAG: hypothetical protein NVS1B7_7600 [Candidatus Saccharimonadales bacterium]
MLSYLPLKRLFDKLTNRIFYRDAYDTQLFLDDFNQVIVSTLDLEELLKASATVIGNTLKASFCFFGIKEMNGKPERIIGTVDPKIFSEDDIQKVRSITPYLTDRIVITNKIESKFSNLQHALNRYDIAVLVRIVTKIEEGQEGIGYLVLGTKKSGSPYNKLDIKTIDIVTKELAIAIQNALRFEEIQTFATTLQQKVDAATHRLQRSNDKLKQMDETKDEFISMASHQLRTPLTSVKGYLSMVLEGDAGQLNEMQHNLLDQAFVSSQRMVYLIADLLNVSRLRTGKFIIEPIPSNLADVVYGEVNQLIETAKGRGLKLVYNKPTSFPTLMLDETKIRQVIMNFTDNAIYYTPSGGHITLNLVDKKETIEFTVVDNGIGVPRAEQHHLFTKFYRAKNAKKARPDGTGLGLFMAQKVIVAQGGSIIFHSQEGKGSSFGFSLVKARLQLPHKPDLDQG